MQTTIKVNCPYCSHRNTFKITASPNKAGELVCCDYENGGCEGEFVIFHRATVEVWVQELGSEGPQRQEVKNS
jgi:hypothetical protein